MNEQLLFKLVMGTFIILIAILTTYGIGTFLFAQPDPYYWKFEGRALMLMVGVFVALVYFGIYTLTKDDK